MVPLRGLALITEIVPEGILPLTFRCLRWASTIDRLIIEAKRPHNNKIFILIQLFSEKFFFFFWPVDHRFCCNNIVIFFCFTFLTQFFYTWKTKECCGWCLIMRLGFTNFQVENFDLPCLGLQTAICFWFLVMERFWFLNSIKIWSKENYTYVIGLYLVTCENILQYFSILI